MDDFQFDSETPKLSNVLSALGRAFNKAGIETAPLDARLILQHVLGLSHSQLIMDPDRILSAYEMAMLLPLIKRRLTHEPVSRIFGEKEFWSLPFYLSSETLDPRPDTECLIEAVLALIGNDKSAPLRILDLGTGTGCILLSLLSELPNAIGVGVDISQGAVETACSNASRHRLQKRVSFLVSDWLSEVDGKFDLVVSNPPYIRAQDIKSLSCEVEQHDPHLALDGGDCGLIAYQNIIDKIGPFLASSSILAFEIGEGQSHDLERLLRRSDFSSFIENVVIKPDLSGIQRVVCAQLKN